MRNFTTVRRRSHRYRPIVLVAIIAVALVLTVERVGDATSSGSEGSLNSGPSQPAVAEPAVPVTPPGGAPVFDHRGPLLLVGDSLTLGADSSGGLSKRLRDQGWQPTIIAERGQGTMWGVSKVKRLKSVPELVVVALGTNPWSTVGTYPTDVQAMIDALKDRGAQLIVWITPVSGHGDDRYDEKDAVLYDVAQSDSTLLVADWSTVAKAHPEWFGTDKIHYVETGYDALARFIVNQVGVLAAEE